MAINVVVYLNKKVKFLDHIPGRVAFFHKKGKIYEIHMLEYIRKLGIGGAYIDVGANIGNHTLFFLCFLQS